MTEYVCPRCRWLYFSATPPVCDCGRRCVKTDVVGFARVAALALVLSLLIAVGGGWLMAVTEGVVTLVVASTMLWGGISGVATCLVFLAGSYERVDEVSDEWMLRSNHRERPEDVEERQRWVDRLNRHRW